METSPEYQVAIPSTSPIQRCPVCDENNASKHYGSYCCSSCKGFFRRTARFQRIYICSYQNNCNITGEFRNACRACRYSKCLSVGMNPLLVQADRGYIKRKNKSQSGSPSDPEMALQSTSALPVEPKKSINAIIKFNDFKRAAIYSWRMPKEITEIEINLPLGRLNLVQEVVNNDAEAVAKYFTVVEKIIDNYKEPCAFSHSSNNFQVHLNLTTAEVAEKPRQICRRSQLDWSANNYLQKGMFKGIWARSVLSYLDWTSFIPELQELSTADKNLMLINRCGQSTWTLLAHRSAVTNAPGILFFSGCYFPRLKNEWKYCEPEIVDMGSRLSDTFNLEIVDEMRSLEMTDEEFAVLRVICFFTAVPQLSKEGYELVQNARRKYANILTELIRVKNASQPFTMIIERINRFMLLLPVFEKLGHINDEIISMLVLFDVACMKHPLSYELHVGKNASNGASSAF